MTFKKCNNISHKNIWYQEGNYILIKKPSITALTDGCPLVVDKPHNNMF